MAASLSRVLTATTVVVLIAVLVVLFLQSATGGSLDGWVLPPTVALGVLVAIRLLLNTRSERSRTAGPVAGSMAVQSGLYGFAPGTSSIEQHGGPAHTTSAVEPDPRYGPDAPPRQARPPG